jgi:four helix bundle protein
MEEEVKRKKFDLDERTMKFARRVRDYVKNLPGSIGHFEDAKQLVRASGSVGANYLEAEEALSKKDFVLRIKISRKEAKESRYWLSLTEPKSEFGNEKDSLIQEATELTKIFGAIIEKSSK